MPPERKTCVACGSSAIGSTYAHLLQCQECNFVFADLSLSVEENRQIYGEDYFHGQEYANYVGERQSLEKNQSRFFRRMIPHTSTGQTLLELGCSYGFFLNLAKERFDVTGVDINDFGPAFARSNFSVRAVGADLASDQFPEGDFDIVCMWDTIEHIPDLDAYMRRILDLTHVGSKIFLTTNDIGSLNARVRGAGWRQIHPPSHLWYFSRPTIERFLEARGFEIDEIDAVGYSRSISGMAHILFSERLPAIPRLLDWSGLGRLRLYLNLGDIFWLAATRVR